MKNEPKNEMERRQWRIKLENLNHVMDRRRLFIGNHNDYGKAIPIECRHSDKWIFEFERDIQSQSEGNTETSPMLILHITELPGYHYKNIPVVLKLKLFRNESLQSLQNPYPSVPGLKYSITMVHAQEEEFEEYFQPHEEFIKIKDYWLNCTK